MTCPWFPAAGKEFAATMVGAPASSFIANPLGLPLGGNLYGLPKIKHIVGEGD